MTFSDLAPGDAKSASLDLSRFQIERIRSVDHPDFGIAYGMLWDEFGAKGEMERRETLIGRFARQPSVHYEIWLVREAGQIAAVRDHTAIAFEGELFVHLSHNLVMPPFRRTGLAGWLRAFPIVTARACAQSNQLPSNVLITLVSEMEPVSSDPATHLRLLAYEKAGFKKVDPKHVHYHQPDFRDPVEIDETGGNRPLPFQLVLRQVNREGEENLPGARLRRIVEALYEIYRPQLRLQEMNHPALALDLYPAFEIALIPPTA